jgi:hypothetical protein
MLKRPQRCYEFYTSEKKTILKESQQVTSLDFNIPIPIRTQKCFAGSPTGVIPRTRQAIGRKQTMITILFTRHKLTVLDISPKRSKFNHPYSIDDICSDLKMANENFCPRIRQVPF